MYVICLACVFEIYSIAPCAYAFEEKPVVSQKHSNLLSQQCVRINTGTLYCCWRSAENSIFTFKWLTEVPRLNSSLYRRCEWKKHRQECSYEAFKKLVETWLKLNMFSSQVILWTWQNTSYLTWSVSTNFHFWLSKWKSRDQVWSETQNSLFSPSFFFSHLWSEQWLLTVYQLL